jgi:hypothetical protein
MFVTGKKTCWGCCNFRCLLAITLLIFYSLFVNFNRTNIFMKEHKQYSNMVLVIALLVFLILGAYTWTPVSQVKKFKSLAFFEL